MNDKSFHRRIACTYPTGETVFVEEFLPRHVSNITPHTATPDYKLLPNNESVIWVEDRQVFRLSSRNIDIRPKNQFSPAHREDVTTGLRLLYG